jgi:hypothetical protein
VHGLKALQILVSVLTPFPTQNLLLLVLVSRRFHSIILRILHLRLLLAAELREYKLILEAYHPSRKFTEPYLFCTYLGTDGLSSKYEDPYESCDGAEGRLAKLGSLYSRFRPESPGITGSMPLRRVAGAAPAQWSVGTTSQPIYGNWGDGGSKKVLHTLSLDTDELFGQLCAYAQLVRLGPRRGVFLSTVQIVKSGEGVIRVWREWLQDRAEDLKQQEEEQGGGDLDKTPTTSCPLVGVDVGVDKSILWTDFKRNIGLRVAVRNTWKRCGIAAYSSDDLPLSFSIEIKGR